MIIKKQKVYLTVSYIYYNTQSKFNKSMQHFPETAL